MTNSSGQLVLVFDDGYREDYEEIWPVLQSAGVPACFAIVPNYVGRPHYVTEAQLRELHDGGCEVLAHGREHRYLHAQRLARKLVAGDDRVYVEGPVYPGEDHGVLPGDEFEVTDGRRNERVVLAGKGEDDAGAFLTFETPVEGSYDSMETVCRPSEDTLRDEIVDVRADFDALGYDPVTFVFPYDSGDVRAWRLAARHYDVLPDAAIRSLPNPPGTPLTALWRYYLETDAMTMTEIEAYLDAVAEDGGRGILTGHSAWESVPPERVAATIEAALQRGIEITTFRAIV